MKKLSIFLVGVWACAGAMAEGMPFKPGERVAFVGDSITHGGYYVPYLQLLQSLRHPGSGVTFYNLGVSGDSAGGGIKRFEREVTPLNADRVFIMFGMNDVGSTIWITAVTNAAGEAARAKTMASYEANMRKLADMVDALKVPSIFATPTPYDEYRAGDCQAAKNSLGLTRAAKFVRELCAAHKGTLVEFHAPFTERMRDKKLSFTGGDRVHPGSEGHLMMLAVLWNALGGDNMVADVTMDAVGGGVKAKRARVSRIECAENRKGVSFVYEPEALPFPHTKDYDAVNATFPLSDKINREFVRVTGLIRGRYALLLDGVEVGVFSYNDVVNGIDFAALPTPNARTALAASNQAMQMRGVQVKLRDIANMREIAYSYGGKAGDEKSIAAALKKFTDECKAKKYKWGPYRCNQVDYYLANYMREGELKNEETLLRRRVDAVRPTSVRVELRIQ